ncbi:hypothetical protein ABBQ32_012910 [Trebouxia sp. C0010 RCD-2024]
MSEFWAGHIDNLETTAEIFFRLTSETQGGNKDHPDYQDLRASRVPLRFAQDLQLATVIQFFWEKEKEHHAINHTPKVRDGGLVRHYSELTDRSPESLALSASKGDFERLSAIVRTLGFGSLSSMQQDG